MPSLDETDADAEVTHLDLLAAAQDLQRIAAAGDEAALHDELCRLRNDVAVHIHDEGLHGSASDSLDHRLARHGQQRLLRYVDDLLSTTADLDAAECACLVRTAELRARLIRQFRLELRLRSPTEGA